MLTMRTDEPGMAPAVANPAMMPIPDAFSFIDIGAGAPASTEPS
jgi:hypothetical protein